MQAAHSLVRGIAFLAVAASFSCSGSAGLGAEDSGAMSSEAGSGVVPPVRLDADVGSDSQGAALEGSSDSQTATSEASAGPSDAAGGSSDSSDAGSGPMTGEAGGPCGVLPVNPKATQQAKNLLCYLYSQYGKRVLSGEQETSWANPDDGMSYIFTNTGKYPVVRGGDYLYPSGTTARAQAWWNAGGIPMLCYHMGAPPQSDTYQNSMTAAAGGINAVLQPGTASYTSFIQKLDYAAAELLKLQAANVAVLLAAVS